MTFDDLSILAAQYQCTLLRARDTNGVIKSGYRLILAGGEAKRCSTLQQVWQHLYRFRVAQAEATRA